MTKRLVHIIGVISIVIAIIYFNCFCSLREGVTNNDYKMQLYNHAQTIKDMKGNICTKRQYNKLVQKVNELEKKQKQTSMVNKVQGNTNAQHSTVTSSS